jgi:hypothetical protein
MLALAASALLIATPATGQEAEIPPVRLFLQTASGDRAAAAAAQERLAAVWREAYSSMLIEIASVLPPSRYGHPEDFAGLPEPRGAQARRRLIRFLEEQTGEEFRDDLKKWRPWMWRLPYEPHPGYMEFKGSLYRAIDPRMERFFPPGGRATIRLDEILWGGVRVNGIPPLDHPVVLPAAAASYLDENNVVFGIFLNGEARAYPQRILAWHEMALDKLGGVELTIVYCTLCGTVIPYDSTVGGKLRKIGTSGFLYRSNKLMFDEGTHSLWSTITGTPVVGELVGSGLRLEHYPVVTTTWGEWKRLHPDTTVLSLETGHDRDYSEGAAYRGYFASDDLMFSVSQTDSRLRNKDEVLALRLEPRGESEGNDTEGDAGEGVAGEAVAGEWIAGEEGEDSLPLAISAGFLAAHPVYELELAGHRLVVITSPEGANRVYERGAIRFADGDNAAATESAAGSSVQDAKGRRWRVTEDALVLEQDPDVRLERVPAYRTFWFGWYAQFPDTRLIR